ncbi:hypothetical protein [Vibrio crassostreae]|uniref:hypothetical protein n=1 Tax=Vibrio crassostreae TaxID=246167 RepID=UPI001B30E96E|nr:hypothetical protein [Vibrio crassostreae]
MQTKDYKVALLIVTIATVALGANSDIPEKTLNDISVVFTRVAIDTLCLILYLTGGYFALILAGKTISNEETLPKWHAAFLTIVAITCLTAGWYGFNGHLAAFKIF